MRRVELHSPAIGAPGAVHAYGDAHPARPVLAFPAEGGDAGQWDREGMVGAIGGLLEAGRVKLYTVDAFDMQTWSDASIPVEERAPTSSRWRSGSRATTARSSGSPTCTATTSTGCAGGCRSCSCAARASGRSSQRMPFSCSAPASQRVLSSALWGHDVAHDWPWWRAQIAHHLPRF